MVFFASLFAVIERGEVNSGLVGLSITYAIEVTCSLYFLISSRKCAYSV